MTGIQALFDNADKAVTINQAFQIFKKPHFSLPPVLFLIIHTVEEVKYHGELHKCL
jgi:hypothetical protein